MSELLNPDDFVIVRKRKKYKFAKFHNAENCFELDEWRDFYRQRQPGVSRLEVGAGTGLFSVELAARYPDKLFVAIDVKADRLQKGAYIALEKDLDNIYFIRARADQIGDLFALSTLVNIWVTFPDPFPKKRAAGRRLTHPYFLRRYAQLLQPGGELLFKHDDRDFFCWSLEQLVAEKWQITELSFALHESSLDDEYKIMTTYEQRWLNEGKAINFVKTTR
ncbi:tRNA (guanosine(46)-N7)-methyltransferase TrmB [Candidatus Saccharibacteria bacterium]|nr:tRNA (guanosine(46)-N7)-methyltransferase TrmB [Candidatus Saccharibacteria bacterium]